MGRRRILGNLQRFVLCRRVLPVHDPLHCPCMSQCRPQGRRTKDTRLGHFVVPLARSTLIPILHPQPFNIQFDPLQQCESSSAELALPGPTLAHFLSRFGTQVTIVEKASTMLTQGHNIDVHGTALNIINKMGLLTELKKRNMTEMGTRFLDENGFPRRRHCG